MSETNGGALKTRSPTPVSRLERLIEQHLWAVHAMAHAVSDQPAGYEIADLSAAQPTVRLQTISPDDPVAGIGVLNSSPVGVSVGWAGNLAANGQGVGIPAGSYMVLPVETNVVDVSAGASAIAADAQVTIIIFKYKKTPRLSAGTLGASGSGLTTVTSESPGAVTVGVASSLILPANLSRKGLQAVNTSANAISIGLGHAAVLGNDIYLVAGAGAWDGTISGKLWLGALYAIAAGAGSNLALAEV